MCSHPPAPLPPSPASNTAHQTVSAIFAQIFKPEAKKTLSPLLTPSEPARMSSATDEIASHPVPPSDDSHIVLLAT